MEYKEWPKAKYMMATTAIHKLGDISSNSPDLCHICGETDEDYIGSWVEGLGFFNVRFPKSTTRDLTDQEIEHFNKLYYQLAFQPAYKLGIKRGENA